VAAPGATPPSLPPDLPADLRAFIDCRSDRVELRDGKAAWIPVPPVLKHTIGLFVKPSAKIAPLDEPGAARVSVRWALVSLDLRAVVTDGRLRMEAGPRRTAMLDEVYAGVDDWVERMNGWLAYNGYRLGTPEVVPGRIALRKEALPGGRAPIA
jgi:hypothetical protein